MKQTEQINNAARMSALLGILDKAVEDFIKTNNVIGVEIWSTEAFDCMLHIERDNNL